MLGPIWQLIHNKFVANSVLLAISYELATNSVVAKPIFSCSVPFSLPFILLSHDFHSPNLMTVLQLLPTQDQIWKHIIRKSQVWIRCECKEWLSLSITNFFLLYPLNSYHFYYTLSYWYDNLYFLNFFEFWFAFLGMKFI
jgi:hypothetical protein